jgi:PrtD family type I secretion system ABC transporter
VNGSGAVSSGLRPVVAGCVPIMTYAGLLSLVIDLLSLASPLYMMVVFDRVLTSRSNETLFVLTAIFAYALALEVLIDKLRTRLFAQLGETVFARLREPVIARVLDFRTDTGEQGHALEDLETLKGFLSGTPLKAAFEIPWIPIFLMVLWAFHPVLALIALVSALILFGLTYLEEVVTKGNQLRTIARDREARDYLQHAVKNAEVLTALNMTPRIGASWENLNEAFHVEARKARTKIGLIQAFSRFTRGILSMGSMATAAYLVINVDGVSPGVTIASTIILGRATAPILTVLNSWKSFIMARLAYQRLDSLLNQHASGTKRFEPPAPKGQLRVERLLYVIRRERTVLNGIHFELAPGEALGIMGASGSGKTTLARLLVGIYQPNEGVARLDGADVFQWSQAGLGQWIGYAPQDQQLFPGTVAENIARMEQAHVLVEEVVAAARRVGAHEIFLKMPKGYDTEVGVGGAFLSGGQRQLVALARACFGEPKLLVLDEPNTFLDGDAEAMLLEMVRQNREDGVTQVIISHKPSLFQDVDKILYLGESRQLLFGPRDEVFARLRVNATPPKDESAPEVHDNVTDPDAHPVSEG